MLRPGLFSQDKLRAAIQNYDKVIKWTTGLTFYQKVFFYVTRLHESCQPHSRAKRTDAPMRDVHVIHAMLLRARLPGWFRTSSWVAFTLLARWISALSDKCPLHSPWS